MQLLSCPCKQAVALLPQSNGMSSSNKLDNAVGFSPIRLQLICKQPLTGSFSPAPRLVPPTLVNHLLLIVIG